VTSSGLSSLFVVLLVAAAVPLLARVIPGRPPQVLLLLIGGILIGPHSLHVASTTQLALFANLGLGFLFLMAGYELDPALLRQHAGRLAIRAWLVSAVVSVAVVGALAATGFVHAFVPVAIGLTTTALGTLLPILRDNRMLGGKFGDYVFASGAVGELLPIIATAVFLGTHSAWDGVIVAGIAALAYGVAWLSRALAHTRLSGIISDTAQETSQSVLRITLVLLVGLLLVTQRFGIEAALGAFFAGMVLRSVHPAPEFADKLDAIGYGLFIPVFFINSGMTLDIASIAANPGRLVVFFVLLLVVRGLPTLVLYRRDLSRRRRVELMFLTATSLPLLVALAEIGLQTNTMLPANAAALVGAGVLSVAIFPVVAVRLHRETLAVPQAERVSD